MSALNAGWRRTYVTTLDGRRNTVDLSKARMWAGRDDFDMDCEISYKTFLHMTISGKWLLETSYRCPTRIIDFSEIAPPTTFCEITLEEAAEWFLERWDDTEEDTRFEQAYPAQMTAYLDSIDIDNSPEGTTVTVQGAASRKVKITRATRAVELDRKPFYVECETAFDAFVKIMTAEKGTKLKDMDMGRADRHLRKLPGELASLYSTHRGQNGGYKRIPGLDITIADP